MLEIRDFELGSPFTLLAEDMRLEGGQMIGLAGASGAGKSTFLKALAGFLPLENGELRWGGENFSSLLPARRPVAMLFQSDNLFLHLTLRQNIALGIKPSGRLDTEQNQELEALAKELRIEEVLDARPRQCSGGQNARAALARVILKASKIVLLDEAFSSLGPAQREELHDIIKERLVERGHLVLFASHQTSELRNWSSEILWLHGARLNFPQKTTHFFVNAPESAKRYFGADLG